jgi:hypothetical protein
LDIDDQLGLFHAPSQLLVLALEPFNLLDGHHLSVALVAALLRRQPFDLAALPLMPPTGQVRGVETFSTEEGPHLA